MLAAGLLARKAVEKGLQPRPLVKTSLAPGSRVVTDYLNKYAAEEKDAVLGGNAATFWRLKRSQNQARD